MDGMQMSSSSSSAMDMAGMTATSAMNMASSTAAMVMSTMASSMDMSGMHMHHHSSTGTAGGAAASATATGAMGGMDMGGMSMGGGSCDISMIWNWNVIDSCFLAEGWHVKTRGQFAGTCIGVFCWVVFLVWLRKARTAFDNYIMENKVRRLAQAGNLNYVQQQDNAHSADKQQTEGTVQGRDSVASSASGSANNKPTVFSRLGGFVMGRGPVDNVGEAGGLPYMTGRGVSNSPSVRPNLLEQLVRALMFGFEYSIVWLLGLILMSYNGYVIISAFLGAFIGFLLFDWDALPLPISAPATPRCC